MRWGSSRLTRRPAGHSHLPPTGPTYERRPLFASRPRHSDSRCGGESDSAAARAPISPRRPPPHQPTAGSIQRRRSRVPARMNAVAQEPTDRSAPVPHYRSGASNDLHRQRLDQAEHARCYRGAPDGDGVRCMLQQGQPGARVRARIASERDDRRVGRARRRSAASRGASAERFLSAEHHATRRVPPQTSRALDRRGRGGGRVCRWQHTNRRHTVLVSLVGHNTDELTPRHQPTATSHSRDVEVASLDDETPTPACTLRTLGAPGSGQPAASVAAR
jgi:hypothetical protein